MINSYVWWFSHHFSCAVNFSGSPTFLTCSECMACPRGDLSLDIRNISRTSGEWCARPLPCVLRRKRGQQITEKYLVFVFKKKTNVFSDSKCVVTYSFASWERRERTGQKWDVAGQTRTCLAHMNIKVMRWLPCHNFLSIFYVFCSCWIQKVKQTMVFFPESDNMTFRDFHCRTASQLAWIVSRIMWFQMYRAKVKREANENGKKKARLGKCLAGELALLLYAR